MINIPNVRLHCFVLDTIWNFLRTSNGQNQSVRIRHYLYVCPHHPSLHEEVSAWRQCKTKEINWNNKKRRNKNKKSLIIKRRIKIKRTPYYGEENDELRGRKRRVTRKKTMSYNVENIVIQSVKLCISIINKLIGQVLAKHREKKKVPKVSFTSVTSL